jgi:uncharacterized protein YdeI (YjbR/CyaY-like superfamily)
MNAKVDRFLERAKAWRPEMEKLREILLGFPLAEELKWGKPAYSMDGHIVVVIAPFKESCSLLLFKGAFLQDPAGILIKPGEHTQAGRQMRFTSVREIVKMEATVRAYLGEAIKVEMAGLRMPKKTSEDLELPEELVKKFKEVPGLKKAFRGLTPGRQRAYVIYFTGAKQSKTREARIEKHQERILGGLGIMD